MAVSDSSLVRLQNERLPSPLTVRVTPNQIEFLLDDMLEFCKDSSLMGQFWCGHDFEWGTDFFFTDPDTAFAFKMRFG